MRILVTGAAGFIGFHVSKRLLEMGHDVVGIDNLNDYYDRRYKCDRLNILNRKTGFRFSQFCITNKPQLFHEYGITDPAIVIHLAAQAGVRYSIENPDAYIQSNIVGFQNVIEMVREFKPYNFVYASSSSVYGANETPFHEDQAINSPVSLYAATKIANEAVAKSYGAMYNLPSTGLRFFTVYGPYGRPDMAMFKFAKAMMAGEPIELYNEGNMTRDFTYIDDIVDGILLAVEKVQIGAVYNLSGPRAGYPLGEMVAHLEAELGVKAQKKYLPMQAGDVRSTVADIRKAERELGYAPKVPLSTGVQRFVDWFKTLC